MKAFEKNKNKFYFRSILLCKYTYLIIKTH